MPKDITIITPSYNQGSFIEETIESVLSQTGIEKEYLIFDGGSTDETVEILNRYIGTIDSILIEPDKGQSDAINKGLSRANGEIINWINSDDYYEPNVLQSVITAFNDESVNVACFKCSIFDEQGVVEVSEGSNIFENNLSKTIGILRIDQQATFFRRSIWKEIGLYVRNDLHYTMDRDLWLRYLLKYGLSGFTKVPIVVANYRLHDQSKTVALQHKFEEETAFIYYSLAKSANLSAEAALLKDLFQIRNSEFIQYDFDIEVKDIRHGIHYYLLWIGEIYYSKGETKSAHKCLDIIDPSGLDKEYAAKLSNLRLRNRFIPLPVLKLYRKIR